MSQFSGRIASLALGAAVLYGGVGAANVEPKTTPQDCRPATPTVLRRVVPSVAESGGSTKFAVVRITMKSTGLVSARELLWNTHDAAFNAASMRAASLTAFAPASNLCVAKRSTFDYVFVSVPGAKRVSAMLIPKGVR